MMFVYTCTLVGWYLTLTTLILIVRARVLIYLSQCRFMSYLWTYDFLHAQWLLCAVFIIDRLSNDSANAERSLVSLHPAVTSGDMGRVMDLKKERQLTDREKYHMLTKHFTPDSTYQFPAFACGKQNRSFQHTWLTNYSGLVYSERDAGGYCKYCVLFGQAPYSVLTFTGTLITLPLTNLKKASEKLRLHFSGTGGTTARKYHLEAVERARCFKATMEKKVLPIDQQLSTIRAKIVSQNMEKIKSIAETIIFCGRQGIAFRGHRDDWKHIEGSPHANPGNFIALLQFRARSGDKVLAEHLHTAHHHHNALYTSKTTQNELIDICGSIVRGTILAEVRTARFFSIMVDEATDAANDEQLTVSIRYVKPNNRTIEERFLAFSECVTGVSGEAIADRILQLLADWQLSATHCRGQTYDGAGAMAGKNKGAASRIQGVYPKAIYTHCAAHALNLCVVKCCSIPEIQNTMDTADSICRFFSNSPKRQLALERWIHETLEGEHRRKLKLMCKTRWVERHEAFEVFVDLFKPLVYCLEDIKDSSEWNRDSRSDAQSLLLALTRFPFIVALVIAKDVLAYTKALSVKLQGRYVDIVRAYNQIAFAKATLQSARDSVDSVHDRMYNEAVQIATKVNVEESMPRTTGRQRHRSNVPSSTPTEYYKRVLTIPALDHLISEMNRRFHHDSTAIIHQTMLLLPSTLAKSKEILTSSNIPDLIRMYEDDLPAPASLDTELHCWSVKWHGCEESSSLCTPAKVLKVIDSDFFPNIEILFKIACTLAVTSAECERSVSRLRYLKTYLRSTMTENRLNGLALLYMHRDISCDPDNVVQAFAQSNPRRMRLQ